MKITESDLRRIIGRVILESKRKEQELEEEEIKEYDSRFRDDDDDNVKKLKSITRPFGDSKNFLSGFYEPVRWATDI